MSVSRLKQIIHSRLGQRGGVVYSVSTLVGGTAFAQGLLLLALPLLTRLYTPEEFSVLAVYAAVLGILSVAACLRFEIAIPLPEKDEDAATLLCLALISGVLLSLIVGLILLFFHQEATQLLRAPALAPYLWMVPVGMWIASAFAAIQYWSTRRKKFTQIARTRMSQAVFSVGVQGGAGTLGSGPVGLLLGHLFSGGVGFVGLARDTWRYDKHLLSSLSGRSMRSMLKKYSHYPTYSTLEALSNTAGVQLPIIIIAALAIGPEAGFLLLATRVMAAPMGLVGGSIAQVYLAHAPEELRAGRLQEFTTRVLRGLFKTGVGPLVFAGIVAGPLAGIAFGKEWERVGVLVAWMTPWFILKFLSSPVSMVMHVLDRQPLMMAMQLIGLVLRVGLIFLAYLLDPLYLAEVYAVSGALFYALCCVTYYQIARVTVRDAISALISSFGLLLGWVAAAFLVRFAAALL